MSKQLKCQFCGRFFKADRWDAKFCEGKCRQKSYRQKKSQIVLPGFEDIIIINGKRVAR